MPETDDVVLLFTEPLRQSGIPYMATGSIACIAYGDPRLTNDLDLVVALKAGDVPKLEAAFPLAFFYLPPPEVILAENARELRGHFNIIHHDTGFRADIYLLGRDPLHAWGFPRRRELPFAGSQLTLAPPEYVIVRKLEFFREGGSQKHLRDIAGILRVSADSVDVVEVERLARDRGLMEQWQAVKAHDRVG